MVFWTRCSFLTKVTNFKHNDSCAECFDANFEQQECCARCFEQLLAFEQKWSISKEKTVAQSVSTPISSNRTVWHGVLHMLYLPNNTGQFKAKEQLPRVF